MYHHKQNIHHKNAKTRRKRRIVIVVCVVLVLLALFLFFDSRDKDPEVTLSRGTITRDAGGEDTITIEEESYLFESPSGWELASRNENALYETNTYHSIAAGETARELTVYINTIPEIPDHAKLNRILPIESQGDSFQVGAVSDHCNTAVETDVRDYDGASVPEPIELEFLERDIICDLNRAGNTVGTVARDGYGTSLVGEQFEQSFFITYTDHTARTDYEVFERIVKSFRQK